MANEDYSQNGIAELRALGSQTIELLDSGSGAQGDLTTEEIVSGWAVLGVITIDVTGFTRPDADEELDFYVQATYDEGENWVDVENVHTETAGAQVRVVVIGIPNTVPTAVTPTDGSLSDNTDIDMPLGDHIRVKVVHTDSANDNSTYDVTITAFLRA